MSRSPRRSRPKRAPPPTAWETVFCDRAHSALKCRMRHLRLLPYIATGAIALEERQAVVASVLDSPASDFMAAGHGSAQLITTAPDVALAKAAAEAKMRGDIVVQPNDRSRRIARHVKSATRSWQSHSPTKADVEKLARQVFDAMATSCKTFESLTLPVVRCVLRGTYTSAERQKVRKQTQTMMAHLVDAVEQMWCEYARSRLHLDPDADGKNLFPGVMYWLTCEAVVSHAFAEQETRCLDKNIGAPLAVIGAPQTRKSIVRLFHTQKAAAAGAGAAEFMDSDYRQIHRAMLDMAATSPTNQGGGPSARHTMVQTLLRHKTVKQRVRAIAKLWSWMIPHSLYWGTDVLRPFPSSLPPSPMKDGASLAPMLRAVFDALFQTSQSSYCDDYQDSIHAIVQRVRAREKAAIQRLHRSATFSPSQILDRLSTTLMRRIVWFLVQCNIFNNKSMPYRLTDSAPRAEESSSGISAIPDIQLLGPHSDPMQRFYMTGTSQARADDQLFCHVLRRCFVEYHTHAVLLEHVLRVRTVVSLPGKVPTLPPPSFPKSFSWRARLKLEQEQVTRKKKQPPRKRTLRRTH